MHLHRYISIDVKKNPLFCSVNVNNLYQLIIIVNIYPPYSRIPRIGQNKQTCTRVPIASRIIILRFYCHPIDAWLVLATPLLATHTPPRIVSVAPTPHAIFHPHPTVLTVPAQPHICTAWIVYLAQPTPVASGGRSVSTIEDKDVIERVSYESQPHRQ